MLSANGKMNNADSLVVLINSLMEEFNIGRAKQTGSGDDGWIITISDKSKAGARTKRDAAPEQDSLHTQATEDVMSALLVQAGRLSRSEILSNEELEDYDLLLKADDATATETGGR